MILNFLPLIWDFLIHFVINIYGQPAGKYCLIFHNKIQDLWNNSCTRYSTQQMTNQNSVRIKWREFQHKRVKTITTELHFTARRMQAAPWCIIRVRNQCNCEKLERAHSRNGIICLHKLPRIETRYFCSLKSASPLLKVDCGRQEVTFAHKTKKRYHSHVRSTTKKIIRFVLGKEM